ESTVAADEVHGAHRRGARSLIRHRGSSGTTQRVQEACAIEAEHGRERSAPFQELPASRSFEVLQSVIDTHDWLLIRRCERPRAGTRLRSADLPPESNLWPALAQLRHSRP